MGRCSLKPIRLPKIKHPLLDALARVGGGRFFVAWLPGSMPMRRAFIGAFKGDIINRENIGKTSADLKAQWNTAHPSDLIP